MNEVIIAAIAAGVGAVLAGLGKLIVDTIKAKKEKTGDLELQYSHQENLVKLVSSQGKELLELENLITSIKEEIKTGVDDLSDKFDDFRAEQKAYNLAMIRHDIVQVYEAYKEKKTIPMPVYQSVLDLYDKYEKLGGNSFVHQLIEEMKVWDKE